MVFPSREIITIYQCAPLLSPLTLEVRALSDWVEKSPDSARNRSWKTSVSRESDRLALRGRNLYDLDIAKKRAETSPMSTPHHHFLEHPANQSPVRQAIASWNRSRAGIDRELPARTTKLADRAGFLSLGCRLC